MFLHKVFARVLGGIKRGVTPPSGSPPRKMFNGAAKAYWPVLLGGTMAILLVATGLSVALQAAKRSQEKAFQAAIKPALFVEGRTVVPGSARIEAPPFAMTVKSPLPGRIPSPKFQELTVVLQPPAPEIEVDSNPQDTTCDTYGTSVNFMRSPIAAARRAAREDKLLFTLHVSGNFEDPQFT